tara:strand:- start:568 stop:921 length:354 start_codon:yes stop_codon:yes gene_type:complete
MKYCFSDSKVTHVPSFSYPQMSKKNCNVDNEVIRRMTFTNEEHRLFLKAMRSYTAKKNTKHLTAKEIFERRLVRHFFYLMEIAVYVAVNYANYNGTTLQLIKTKQKKEKLIYLQMYL